MTNPAAKAAYDAFCKKFNDESPHVKRLVSWEESGAVYQQAFAAVVDAVLNHGATVGLPIYRGLETIQKEVGKWSRENFGDNVSKWTGQKLYSQNALTGVVEEVGDLNKITIQYHQGRRGYDPTTEEGQKKYIADRNDALADIMIFLLDYCEREGVDLLTVVSDTWSNIVSKRSAKTRADWEKHSHDAAEAAAGAALEVKPVANAAPTPEFLDQLDQYIDVARQVIQAVSPTEMEHWKKQVLEAIDKGYDVTITYPSATDANSQTGQGWAEPAEEPAPTKQCEAERLLQEKAKDNATYSKRCAGCGGGIHHTSSATYCAQCTQERLAKSLPV